MELKRHKTRLKWTSKNCRLVIRIINKNPNNLTTGFQQAAKRLSKMYDIEVSASTIRNAYYSNKMLNSYKKIAIMSPVVCVIGNKVVSEKDLQKNHTKSKIFKLLKTLKEFFNECLFGKSN